MIASIAFSDPLALRQPGTHSNEVVMPFTQGIKAHASVHEHAARTQVARRVAELKGCAFSEEIAQPLWTRRTYLVPSDTLVAPDVRRLHLYGEDDLLGGVVPHAFLATKAITHPLVAASAAAPEGWHPLMAELMQTAVLPGYTAFTRQDALHAGEKMLAQGPVRIKPVGESGGRGQTVASDMTALAARLSALDNAALLAEGVVLEHNLVEVETLSVGQIRVAGVLASYCGTQRLTHNNSGDVAYGGSDLTVVRGDFRTLLSTLAPGPLRKAVDQALVYDAAVRSCYPGFFASRVNYDVAQGLTAQGQWCSGVLEQSWRIGGATGAELAALEAFHGDKALRKVRASSIEKYGELDPVPAGATTYFQGDDPEVGPLTKYALVHPDGDAA